MMSTAALHLPRIPTYFRISKVEPDSTLLILHPLSNQPSSILLTRSRRQHFVTTSRSVTISDYNQSTHQEIVMTRENSDQVVGISEEMMTKKPATAATRDGGWESRSAAPIVAMVVVQVIFAGSQILTKLAINKGMLVFAILTYRHLVAAICIAPLAFLFDRKVDKNLNPRVCLWTFFTALTGITLGMGLFYYGLKDTSATYATNFSNLIPIATFFLSVVVRMETLKLNNRWGRFKIVGAFLCVGGALVISLYKGISLPFFHLNSHHKAITSIVSKRSQHWIRGTILLVSSCAGYALWFIAQARLLKVLPSKNMGNLLTCVTASIQTAILGICLDRSGNSWSLGWNVKLINVLFSGALASAASFYLIIWAVEKKGPTYPSMFDPLSVVFVAIIEAIFFGEDFTIGILLGMILMIAGLYSYLWGKRGELRNNSTINVTISSANKEVVGSVASLDV